MSTNKKADKVLDDMEDVVVNMEEKAESVRGGIYDLSRKVLLAAVGAAALAQDEVDGFVDRLVERGELAEKDARSLVKEINDRREKVLREKRAEMGRRRPSNASKDDIDALTAKIAELSKQIEELKKA